MTAYNIVRVRVKKGRQEEFEGAFRQWVAVETAGRRRSALIRSSETNYCGFGEWENYDALADSRSDMAARRSHIFPMLEDLGGGLGVTYAVSGEAVVEIGSGPPVPRPREGAPPCAWNVVRHRVKAGRAADFEAHIRSTFAAPFSPEFEGLEKIALVGIGPRSYCLVGQWQSLAHLTRARPSLDKDLDSQRDLFEDLGGGQGVANALSGEAVVDVVTP